MAYEHMASVYDELMEDAPYGKWHTMTEILFKKYGKDIRKVADLGCGTGQITNRLAASGYQMTGIDLSEEMLAHAQHEAEEQQLGVQWIHQDITELEGIKEMDAIISYCDVMNYITEKDALLRTFEHVWNALDEGGIFIFDVHAMALVERMTNQTFADVTEDTAYIWFCLEGEVPGEMYHELTFFIQNEDTEDTYERKDESHHQCTYPIRTYVDLLQQAGFENCKVYRDFILEENFQEENADRIFFFARKNA